MSFFFPLQLQLTTSIFFRLPSSRSTAISLNKNGRDRKSSSSAPPSRLRPTLTKQGAFFLSSRQPYRSNGRATFTLHASLRPTPNPSGFSPFSQQARQLHFSFQKKNSPRTVVLDPRLHFPSISPFHHFMATKRPHRRTEVELSRQKVSDEPSKGLFVIFRILCWHT